MNISNVPINLLSKPNFMPPTQAFKRDDLEEMWGITENFFFFVDQKN